MYFNQAIKKMKEGHKVKISSWLGTGWWEIIKGRIVCKNMNCRDNNPHNVALLKSKDWIVTKDTLIPKNISKVNKSES